MKNRKSFIKVLNVLEGFKTVFKEEHWISKQGFIHELFDKTINEISDFQDIFAEAGQTVFGAIEKGDINGIKPNTPAGVEAFADLKAFSIAIANQLDFYNKDNNLSGLKSATDNFLLTIDKFILLGGME